MYFVIVKQNYTRVHYYSQSALLEKKATQVLTNHLQHAGYAYGGVYLSTALQKKMEILWADFDKSLGNIDNSARNRLYNFSGEPNHLSWAKIHLLILFLESHNVHMYSFCF